MNRIRFSLPLYCLISLVLLSCNDSEKQPQTQEPPNILFIAVDDLRPELGAYGAKHIKSPVIDRLAAESMLFERAYCNVPVCGASRASLLSGIRPGRFRFITYDTYLDKDYPGITSLPGHFKNNGYTTISNGKIYHHKEDDQAAWNEVWFPETRNGSSWRDYLNPENLKKDTSHRSRGLPFEKMEVPDTAYFDGRIAQKTINDLKKLKTKNQPFFLAAGFLKPHLPFNAPAKYWELYDSSLVSLPQNYHQPSTTPKEAFHNFGELRNYAEIPKNGPVSDKMARQLIHGYYACVSYVDAQIGKVLAALEQLELAQNTIVVLWGDHGWNLGNHQMWCKHCNFESSLHVPLLLKVPGKTKGQRSNAIVEFIDIYPSLCELAGLPVPEHAQGESLVPIIEGKERQKNYAIAKWHDGLTLIQDKLFYTEWLDQDDQKKASMLFDHSTDSLEVNNLIDDPSYQVKAEEMGQLLRKNWGADFFINKKQAVKR